MSERQSGSYGLRKAAAPKKYDNDFEYYYTKIKTAMDSPAPLCIKEERDAKIREKLMSKNLEAT